MFLTSQPKQENPIAVLTRLIQKLNIRVSSFTISHDLQEHPNYPSLLALSDCLNKWKIPHETFKIDKNEYKAEDLSFPFVAHFVRQGEQFILVHEIGNGKVKYSDEQKTNNIITEAEFLNYWTGIILYAEKDKQSGETNYKNTLINGWLSQARLPFLVLILFACIFISIRYEEVNWSYLSLLGIKLAGITVCSFLLVYSINNNNPFIQNLCNLGEKNNCNTILKSDAAKINSWLSWSEVGMFYFAGSFICLLFYPGSTEILFFATFASLPYTFYSIGYQLKIKNWCLLCCTVQILLWLEALIFLFDNSLHFTFSTFSLALPTLHLYILCFLFPVAAWVFIKPIILKAEQSQSLKQQLNKFKYNNDLFNQMLAAQPHYAIPDDLMPISLGNPNAKTVITMISNPFCGPCASAHKTLHEWLNTRDDIHLKIIFTSANHDNDLRTKVARHITTLGLLKDKVIVKEALMDWYNQTSKEYESWATRYPVTFNGEMSIVTEKQKHWCKMVQVTFTPTILVNGYKLSEPYRLEDIKYLLS